MSNIEKFRVDETIRLSYLKHGGNVLKVADELHLDITYVRKTVGKFRKSQERDISRLVANDLTRYILMGSEQRRNRLIEIINALTDEEQNLLSVCHGVPVKEHIFDGESHYICLECREECKVTTTSRKGNYAMILEYNEQLRAEDELLLTFAEKMGYTDREEATVNKITQYNFTVGKTSSPPALLDGDIVKNVENMLPAERESLRKSIESKIINNEE